MLLLLLQLLVLLFLLLLSPLSLAVNFATQIGIKLCRCNDGDKTTTATTTHTHTHKSTFELWPLGAFYLTLAHVCHVALWHIETLSRLPHLVAIFNTFNECLRFICMSTHSTIINCRIASSAAVAAAVRQRADGRLGAILHNVHVRQVNTTQAKCGKVTIATTAQCDHQAVVGFANTKAYTR